MILNLLVTSRTIFYFLFKNIQYFFFIMLSHLLCNIVNITQLSSSLTVIPLHINSLFKIYKTSYVKYNRKHFLKTLWLFLLAFYVLNFVSEIPLHIFVLLRMFLWNTTFLLFLYKTFFFLFFCTSPLYLLPAMFLFL